MFVLSLSVFITGLRVLGFRCVKAWTNRLEKHLVHITTSGSQSDSLFPLLGQLYWSIYSPCIKTLPEYKEILNAAIPLGPAKRPLPASGPNGIGSIPRVLPFLFSIDMLVQEFCWSARGKDRSHHLIGGLHYE